MWWKRHLDLTAAAFFRGTLAPSLASLHGLERAGIAVEAASPERHQQWIARLRHPEWGDATLRGHRLRAQVSRLKVNRTRVLGAWSCHRIVSGRRVDERLATAHHHQP